MKIINKTMDRNDLKTKKALAIADELNNLIRELQSRKLKISSWFGRFNLTGDKFERIMRGYNYKPLEGAADDNNFPWFKYWEIAWIVSNNNFQPESTVLDLGGSSSLFSFYLASRGLNVTTIDIRDVLTKNADYVAKKMGWKLRNFTMDMTNMHFTEKFDNITSLCVFEHLQKSDRIHTIRTIRDLLADGGHFSITFDFGINQIETPADVHEQFVRPSGLQVRGNQTFVDNGKRYLLHPFYYRPWSWKLKASYILYGNDRLSKLRELFKTKENNDFTFGALFQE